ncbi:Ubiquitin carboxyl-terminal hydrolase CYLD [Orchesella cincta]|uniref:Ubiquitin carboxyl-terminal hydrolase CYLD n=1 Tax=Orchesella cincta TaxID=48709 RepID=A0A1D2M6G5_ORCCI|nr:Ubiquitin carboxyl-terminal hydrolase CYLD [Orchesella cincta]
MDIEFLITDKRLYNMQQEVFASSELHSSFPRYKTSKDYSNHDTIVIPNLIVPHSKYSSTETELSSLEENVDTFCREDVTKLTPFEFSVSASYTASGRKIRRRRKSNGRSSSTLSLNSTGSAASYESKAGGLFFLSLNSVRDLEHAIGRHRGVSGSSVPSIDAAIFGMFYMTDIFDTLLLTEPRFSRDGSTSLLGGNIRALLKKEIVYSLRVNYYCPVSKMAKLAQLLEEHSPLTK